MTCRDVSFAIDILHTDFFDRVCAYMEVPRDSSNLGWRLDSDRRNDPIHRLVTAEDVDDAFKAAIEKRSRIRTKKDVVIEIINLVIHLAILFPFFH